MMRSVYGTWDFVSSVVWSVWEGKNAVVKSHKHGTNVEASISLVHARRATSLSGRSVDEGRVSVDRLKARFSRVYLPPISSYGGGAGDAFIPRHSKVLHAAAI
jgi:hypothetical protein